MRFYIFNILNKVIINSLALVYLIKTVTTTKKKFKVNNHCVI